MTGPKDAPPPTFKVWTPPVKRRRRGGPSYKDSPRSRGYDGRWDRLSIAFRKKHPFCRWCEQNDRDTLADVVDHILPAADFPDLMYELGNLQSLCTDHHAMKGKMEVFARQHGMLEMLKLWSADMSTRPPQFRPLVAESLLMVKKPRGIIG